MALSSSHCQTPLYNHMHNFFIIQAHVAKIKSTYTSVLRRSFWFKLTSVRPDISKQALSETAAPIYKFHEAGLFNFYPGF